MKKKIFSILFALVLVVTMSLVTAVPAAAADLTSLTENLAADFAPAFSAEVYGYALAATNAENSVTLTATLAGGAILIVYYPAPGPADPVASGVGKTIVLDVGANVIPIRVTDMDTWDIDDYTITVTRAAAPAQYSLTVASTDGGAVTEPGEGPFLDYDEDEVVDLLAVPEALYQFVEWTGDIGTIDDADAADTFITMSGDYSITANFELIPITYDLGDIQSMLEDIEAKLDSDPDGTFYTFVNNWFTTIKDYVKVINWTDVTDIKTAIGTINISSIKAKTDDIVWSNITDIKTQTDKLGDATIGLAAIKDAIGNNNGGGGGVVSASDTNVSIARNSQTAGVIILESEQAFWGQLTVQSNRAGYNIEVWDGDSWVRVVSSGTVAHSVALSGFGLRIFNDTTYSTIEVDYVFVYHSAP